jgi:hypothetical protein
MPRSLDLDRLKQFEPRPQEPAQPVVAAPAPVTEDPHRWPSREPARDGQVSIKAPLDTIARFRKLCRDDRRTYADMLEILMDRFEGREER